MDLPKLYWKAGIAVNQPEERIIAWKKAQKKRFDEPIDNSGASEEFPYGDKEPMFKTEKDEDGKERYYVYMSRHKTFVTAWLRNAIFNKTLGLGKMNDYMLYKNELGEVEAKYPINRIEKGWYENITGEPDDR